MSTARAYEEVIDFLAAEMKPGALLAFHPSQQAKERVRELMEKEKEGGISAEEKSELDHYMQLEHLMRLTKARARQNTGS